MRRRYDVYLRASEEQSPREMRRCYIEYCTTSNVALEQCRTYESIIPIPFSTSHYKLPPP